MREFIGGAFIFVGLLTIPAAVIGLISPAKLAKSGDPVPSRARIIFSMAAALFIFTVIGVSILPEKESVVHEATVKDQDAQAPKTDAELIKTARSQMATTEDQFIKQQDHFLATLKKAAKEKRLTELDGSRSFGDLLVEMATTLDQAGDMEIPAITNSDAKRYITEAIDTHKKWAMTQQAKINAAMKSDGELAKEMGSQADKLAMQEALALSMAYKAVGLSIE
jgi:hypothetical protein